jgi:hypothetical protein
LVIFRIVLLSKMSDNIKKDKQQRDQKATLVFLINSKYSDSTKNISSMENIPDFVRFGCGLQPSFTNLNIRERKSAACVNNPVKKSQQFDTLHHFSAPHPQLAHCQSKAANARGRLGVECVCVRWGREGVSRRRGQGQGRLVQTAWLCRPKKRERDAFPWQPGWRAREGALPPCGSQASVLRVSLSLIFARHSSGRACRGLVARSLARLPAAMAAAA